MMEDTDDDNNNQQMATTSAEDLDSRFVKILLEIEKRYHGSVPSS